jgi:TolB-like protein/DNA-binding winged helix-turn-helix (wHTH) protein/cytochrome c-type biogenesis protein CcmH/NrfG
MSARLFRFDGWTLDLQSGELERGEARTRLSEHPLQVLAALLENPGDVVTREQLISRLWPDRVVDFDAGLNSAVRKLRVALGDTADTPVYIETLPRRGYRFIGVVEEPPGPEVSPAEVPPLAEPAPPVATEKPRAARRWSLLGFAIAGVLVVAGLLLWKLRGAPVPPDRTFAPPPRSVAVLPFVNMSGDSAQEYFSDGLSEELLNTLSQIDELRVAAQTSSFSFKGKSADLHTIAHKLNVATVLEGSVRRYNNTVRITAQLVDGNTGFHLWSKTYDRNLGDALALQTEIATAVASALKITLLSSNNARSDVGGTHNVAALDAYLHGLNLAMASVRSGEEARQTIAAFDEALRLDPNFALAYAARSRARVVYGSYFMVQAGPNIFDLARADATRAIALAPDLGEGHALLAQVLEIGFLEFGQAEDEYERAMAISPGSAWVLQAYSRFAANMGRADTALTTAKRALELDPLNILSYRMLGEAYESARRLPEAAEAFAGAIKLSPAHATEAYQRLGRLYYLMGDIQKAKQYCEAEPDTYHQQVCMPLIYERLGQREAAEAALRVAIAAQGDGSAYQYAQTYAQWGEPEKALDWLDVGLRVRDPGMESLKTDSFMDPLRKLPRFKAVEQALRYPPN